MGQPLAFAFLLKNSGFPLSLQAFKLAVTNNQTFMLFLCQLSKREKYVPLFSLGISKSARNLPVFLKNYCVKLLGNFVQDLRYV